MPAKLFTGEDAQDVAAYVASAVSKSGEDKGQLGRRRRQALQQGRQGRGRQARDPRRPERRLAYQFASAEAPAGPLEIDSQNDSSVDHDIAIEGNGVNEKGEIVKDGGVSKISADLKAGDYTFFCSVPGHREGGMEGKLTVK